MASKTYSPHFRTIKSVLKISAFIAPLKILKEWKNG
jgi:hypothetical protein